MNAQWRLFLAALGWVTHVPSGGGDAPPRHVSRFVPAVGVYLGLIAAVVYWAAAQLWPASLAVVLSMAATVLMTAARHPPRAGLGAVYWVFVLLMKYNALMALSAASVPLPLPAYCALGLIMVAAQAASRGLVVSVMAGEATAAGPREAAARATEPRDIAPQVSAGDLIIALLLGLAPAVLLGIPGLIALVAAIGVRLGLTAAVLGKLPCAARERLEVVQHVTELSFYLGALASWKYI